MYNKLILCCLVILYQNILLDNNVVTQTKCTKFLGLFIDDKLSWRQHVDHTCKLLSRNVGIINKLKHYFPSNILFNNIYNALILPYISYGVLTWGKTSFYLLNRIIMLQKGP